MLISMTGYGKSSGVINNKKISVEIKSVNHKFINITTKLPNEYLSKEIEIKKMIEEKLKRGKININITVEYDASTLNFSIYKEKIINYYKELKKIEDEIGTNEPLLKIIMSLPDVIQAKEKNANNNEFEKLNILINDALKQVNQFRIKEGKHAETNILKSLKLIDNNLKLINKYEKERNKNIKEKLSKKINQYINNEEIDKSRFEQELLYYLEKMDINEEKNRIQGHCKHFLNTIKSSDANGKKLSFIAQEIAREINTIASKANNLEIQKIVVDMKTELEKIKEQLMNIV